MSEPLIIQLQSLLPANWQFTALIFDGNHDLWEVTARSSDLARWVMKKGTTLEESFEATCTAIVEEDYWRPSVSRSSIVAVAKETRAQLATAASDILSLMGLAKRDQPPVKRRVIP